MAKDVIMPALGMAQETGTLIQWLKAPGDSIAKGEPLMEIETDKATVEIDAPASGTLANVTAQPGDVIPVGQVIALILAAGERAPTTAETIVRENAVAPLPPAAPIKATPVAQRAAAEHNVDLAQIRSVSQRVQKGDVLAFVAQRDPGVAGGANPQNGTTNGRVLASPKARRLSRECGVDLLAIAGTGPDGAVLAADVLAYTPPQMEAAAPEAEILPMSRLWRVMTERLTHAWTTIPHFYLTRDVNASGVVAWLAEVRERTPVKVTHTDLLVKLVAAALRQHPRLNAAWHEGNIRLNREVNIGLAVAVEDGLVVPVIHGADTLGLAQIAERRIEVVSKAQVGKIPLEDLSGGTFTISNLGMYGVDGFSAIVNPPQAAILAVGAISERIVPVNGQPAVQMMVTLSLSCDHRVTDGARAAQFLQTLANLMENPLRLLD